MRGVMYQNVGLSLAVSDHPDNVPNLNIKPPWDPHPVSANLCPVTSFSTGQETAGQTLTLFPHDPLSPPGPLYLPTYSPTPSVGPLYYKQPTPPAKQLDLVVPTQALDPSAGVTCEMQEF